MRRATIILCALQCLFCCRTEARESLSSKVLRRVFIFAVSVDSAYFQRKTSSSTLLHREDTTVHFSYLRYKMNIARRNPTLLAVPSMYAVARGEQRHYYGESFYRVTKIGKTRPTMEQIAHVGNIPRQRMVMTSLLPYLTPTLYKPTLVDDYLLSPFHRQNAKFYRYSAQPASEGLTYLYFRPRRHNTQLVSGKALIVTATGRIVECRFSGEFDMIRFTAHTILGNDSSTALTPLVCEVESVFRFFGNKVVGQCVAHQHLAQPSDSLLSKKDPFVAMDSLRPDRLTPPEQFFYDSIHSAWQRDQEHRALVTDTVVHRPTWKVVLWDIIGNNVLNRVKSYFGDKNQGYVRLNPVLNPLYMGYSHRRGFIYKFDLRASYVFSDRAELNARLRAGYSFGQHRLYFRLPIFYYFNKPHNGYIRLEVSSGNRVYNQLLQRTLEGILPDSVKPGTSSVGDFKNNETRLVFNYDFSSRWSIQLGLLYQDYLALHPEIYRMLGFSTRYRSLAPLVELQWRPMGWEGPIITVDYDRGLKQIFHSNMDYERWEANFEYIHRLDRLRSIQMRVGAGMYSKGLKRNYFLNYENFHENNLPGGWNDDWSGEFELLNSDDYNFSNYYLRGNLTYESPLLLLSWLPWVGRVIELERIYISSLHTNMVRPYFELGYGFTTRLFSMGVFLSHRKGRFEGLGCKFGLELFRKW